MSEKIIYAKATAFYCNTRKPVTVGKYHLGEYKLQFELQETDTPEFAQYFEEHAKEYEGRNLLSLYSRYPFYCEVGNLTGHTNEFQNIENGTEIQIALRPYENKYGTFYTVVGISGQLEKTSGKRLFGQQVAGQQVAGQQVAGQQVAGQQVAGQQVTAPQDDFMQVVEDGELPF